MSLFIIFTDNADVFHARPSGGNTIASYLNDIDYPTQVITNFLFQTDEEFQEIVKRQITSDTMFVGFSGTVLYKYQGRIGGMEDDQILQFFGMPDEQFIQRLDFIKTHAPHIKFILGGGSVLPDHISCIPHIIPYFSYIVIGQGETSIKNILDFETGKIANLKKDILLSSTYNTTVTSDKLYPYDNFSSTSLKWSESDYLTSKDLISIEIARGCIFKCSYCTYGLLGKKFGDYTREANIIREELIRNYNEFGITNYWATDEIINDSEDKVHFLVDIIESLPFKIKMGAYARLDLFWKYPWMISALKDAGVIAWDMGLESIDKKSGAAVGKGLGEERIYETLCNILDITKSEVFIKANWILGLPNDTPESLEHLIEFLKKPEIHKVISTNSPTSLKIMDGNKANFSNYTTTHNPVLPYYNWVSPTGLTTGEANAYTNKIVDYFNTQGYLKHAFHPFNILAYLDEFTASGISMADINTKLYSDEEKERVLNKHRISLLIQKQQYLENLMGATASKTEMIAVKKYMALRRNLYRSF